MVSIFGPHGWEWTHNLPTHESRPCLPAARRITRTGFDVIVRHSATEFYLLKVENYWKGPFVPFTLVLWWSQSANWKSELGGWQFMWDGLKSKYRRVLVCRSRLEYESGRRVFKLGNYKYSGRINGWAGGLASKKKLYLWLEERRVAHFLSDLEKHRI